MGNSLLRVTRGEIHFKTGVFGNYRSTVNITNADGQFTAKSNQRGNKFQNWCLTTSLLLREMLSMSKSK